MMKINLEATKDGLWIDTPKLQNGKKYCINLLSNTGRRMLTEVWQQIYNNNIASEQERECESCGVAIPIKETQCGTCGATYPRQG